MAYKLDNNYQTRGIFNKITSGLTGLALLVTSSGCVDGVNGVNIRDNQNYKFKAEESKEALRRGGIIAYPGSGSSSQDDDSGFAPIEWIKENPGKTALIGGGAISVGAGIYFGMNELSKKSRHDDDRLGGIPYPGGPGGGETSGPGGGGQGNSGTGGQ